MLHSAHFSYHPIFLVNPPGTFSHHSSFPEVLVFFFFSPIFKFSLVWINNFFFSLLSFFFFRYLAKRLSFQHGPFHLSEDCFCKQCLLLRIHSFWLACWPRKVLNLDSIMDCFSGHFFLCFCGFDFPGLSIIWQGRKDRVCSWNCSGFCQAWKAKSPRRGLSDMWALSRTEEGSLSGLLAALVSCEWSKFSVSLWKKWRIGDDELSDKVISSWFWEGNHCWPDYVGLMLALDIHSRSPYAGEN